MSTGRRFARIFGGRDKFGGVSEEISSRPDNCSKFLLSGGPSCDYFWGRNMGLDDSDAAKTEGITRGFLGEGDRDVGK